jgi:hypothetical protein
MPAFCCGKKFDSFLQYQAHKLKETKSPDKLIFISNNTIKLLFPEEYEMGYRKMDMYAFGLLVSLSKMTETEVCGELEWLYDPFLE